ncbi:hypothetical protein FRX31_021810 [Thalictrum thalictroides]|uniref:Uncharacterized protein n=1 Tax=Thalictrum thalictroides TaxID=46969 RepID=A0A7J6VUZ6_THATH|nr:hypothetical protein FRX31_021810 [Thalictrum thalictroides]
MEAANTRAIRFSNRELNIEQQGSTPSGTHNDAGYFLMDSSGSSTAALWCFREQHAQVALDYMFLKLSSREFVMV